MISLPRPLRWSLLASLVLSGMTAADTPLPLQPLKEHRFEKQVRAYEAADRVSPAPRHAILLVGDSQFYRWKTLAEDLPDYTVVNRGIDSFEFSDLNYFFDRLVTPYQPRLIVLHVGANDLHNGKTPERVLSDFKTFVTMARAKFPGVPIIFSSTTPGPARWSEADRRRETNRIVREYVATDPGLRFIDLWNAMLKPNGMPRDDIWMPDRVHPNHEGYLIRVRLMRPLLGQPDRGKS